MAAVTLLGSATWTTASGTKTVTATPTAGRLPIVITAHTGNTSASAPTDNQGDGGTYSAIATAVNGGGINTLIAWVRSKAITSSVSTIFTHAPGVSTGGGLAVLEVSGMSKVGAAAVLQSAKIENQASARPSITLGATPQSANPIIGAVLDATNPATVAQRTGYTEHFDLGYATPASGLEVMSLNSGETSATIQWGAGATGSAWCGIVLELDVSAAAAEGVGSSSGTGTASGVGNAQSRGVGSAAGAAAGTAVGNAQATGVGSGAGTGSASGVGNAQATGVGSSAGAAAATGVSNVIVSAVGAAEGVADGAGVGNALASGVGSSSGSASASCVGQSIATAAGDASGSAEAEGFGLTGLNAVGLADGTASASGVGAALVTGVGASDGSAEVDGHGIAAEAGQSNGSSAGSSQAIGTGAALSLGVALSDGFGVAVGEGRSIARAVGSSTGTAAANGDGSSVAFVPVPANRTTRASTRTDSISAARLTTTADNVNRTTFASRRVA